MDVGPRTSVGAAARGDAVRVREGVRVTDVPRPDGVCERSRGAAPPTTRGDEMRRAPAAAAAERAASAFRTAAAESSAAARCRSPSHDAPLTDAMEERRPTADGAAAASRPRAGLEASDAPDGAAKRLGTRRTWCLSSSVSPTDEPPSSIDPPPPIEVDPATLRAISTGSSSAGERSTKAVDALSPSTATAASASKVPPKLFEAAFWKGSGRASIAAGMIKRSGGPPMTRRGAAALRPCAGAGGTGKRTGGAERLGGGPAGGMGATVSTMRAGVRDGDDGLGVTPSRPPRDGDEDLGNAVCVDVGATVSTTRAGVCDGVERDCSIATGARAGVRASIAAEEPACNAAPTGPRMTNRIGLTGDRTLTTTSGGERGGITASEDVRTRCA